MPVLSKHAVARANQRGITHRMIDDLIRHADVEVPAGGGCVVLRISRENLTDPDTRDTLRSNPDKLASLALVWREDTAEIVTLLIDHGRPAGRRYRRRL